MQTKIKNCPVGGAFYDERREISAWDKGRRRQKTGRSFWETAIFSLFSRNEKAGTGVQKTTARRLKKATNVFLFFLFISSFYPAKRRGFPNHDKFILL